MARKVKCKSCGNQLTNDIAYKVVANDKNTYYCNKEEYDLILSDKNGYHECNSMLLQIMKVPFCNSMSKELKQLKQYYDYTIIKKTIEECRPTLEWFVNTNGVDNEYAAARYFGTILSNSINKIARRHQKEQEEMKKLFEKEESREIDIEIINIDYTPKKQNNNDISEFLFD